MDHYISAATEAAMRTALTELGLATLSDDGHLAPVEGVSLDILGTWYEDSPDPEAPPKPVPGYHANLRTDVPIAWPPSITEHQPATPWRVWA